jgi:pseudoazurin
MKKFVAVLALGAAVAFAGMAGAAEIEVKMLNKGSDGQAMVFEPAAIRAAPGDVIRFVPVDKGHNAAAVKGLIPEGTAEFIGKINQGLSVTVEQEGAYVIKCAPHLGMGMVALVVVGEGAPANIDAVKSAKMPKKAKDRLDAAVTQLGL